MQKDLQEVQGNKKGKQKLVILGLVIIATCILVTFVKVKISAEGSMTYNKDAVMYDPYTDIFYNYKGDVVECEDEFLEDYSSDYKVTTVLGWDNNKLYYVNKKMEQVLIAEDVLVSKVSYDGSYVAYIQGERGDQEGDLYLYHMKSGKSYLISSYAYINYFCVSIDGKSIAYIKNYNDYDEDMEIYLSDIKGNEKKIDTVGSYPIAVANGGKSLYYMNFDNIISYYNGEESVQFDTKTIGTVFFNKKATEILYMSEDDTYYFNPEMEAPKKVLNNTFPRIMEDNIYFEYYNSNDVIILNKDTLKSSFIKNKDGIYWMDKDTEITQISTNPDCSMAAINGQALLFIEDGKLYKNDKPGKKTDADLLYDAEPLVWFVASDDLAEIYVVTEEKDLLYYKGGNECEVIIEGVIDAYSNDIAYNNAMDKVFYIMRHSDNVGNDFDYAGKDAESIVEVCGNVWSVYKLLDGVTYTAGDSDYFMDGEKAVLISE